MSTNITIETVSLPEILDLGWPTDPALVVSFRKTLQQGGHFSPIRLNRVWQEDASWHYQIIDGFHRFEASRTEHVEALLCQVEELSERAARYERIRACIGKSAEVTIQRAQRELKGAFVDDMLAHIGHPDPLYEPTLGEDGLVHARRHLASLPADPLQALEVLTDHLIVTTLTSHTHASLSALAERPFGPRAGWEQIITAWIEEMSQQWGYNTFWLLDLLHVEALLEGEPENRSARRQAQLLWQIPDVDVRHWFRRQFQLQPRGDLVEQVIEGMGFYYQVTGGGVREGAYTRKKSEVMALLSRYPSLTELSAYLEAQRLRKRDEPPDAPWKPDTKHPEMAHETSAPEAPAPAIFAIGSPGFVGAPSRGSAPETKLPSARAGQSLDREMAYLPVHEACVAFLRAARTLMEECGTDWLRWDPAQADLAELRRVLQWG
jgi:hypothetical protein